jgi:SAM-dependent methyltransferase
MSGYALDNSWQQARYRLSLLQQYLDPISRRRLTALGIAEGMRCLEIAAGAGSMAFWMCERVGAGGRVVATDINTELLRDAPHRNLQVLTHDVMTDAPPEGGQFDFVHVRWLLHHLPRPELAIGRMVDALRPGGWLLVEDVDFFPLLTSTSPVYRDFMLALARAVVLRASGRDCFWARALPALVAGMGLRQTGAEGDFQVIQGGSPLAEFFSLTATQMRDRILESRDLDEGRLDEALDLLKDPGFWGLGGAGIAVWGQRPAQWPPEKIPGLELFLGGHAP